MKTNLVKMVGWYASCAILAGLLAGCAWSIGEGKDRVTTTHPTRGQELIDLKRARDQNAITEAEYETQKAQILAR